MCVLSMHDPWCVCSCWCCTCTCINFVVLVQLTSLGSYSKVIHSHTHICTHSHVTHITHIDEGISCSKQASFGAGVLISKVCTGRHPLADYPLHHTNESGLVSFTKDDILQFPGIYPKSFHSILQDLLACDPQRRLSIGEALNQLRVCCMPRRNSIGAADTPELRRVREKRDELRVSRYTHCTVAVDLCMR